MEKCMCCGQETSHTATVYLKAPGTSPVKQTEYFCGNCVKKRSGGLSSIIFYLALQLCWFTALKTGLFTPFGILSACIALVGLWRLTVFGFARLSGKFSADDASEALKRFLLERDISATNQILNMREYQRTYKTQ